MRPAGPRALGLPTSCVPMVKGWRSRERLSVVGLGGEELSDPVMILRFLLSFSLPYSHDLLDTPLFPGFLSSPSSLHPSVPGSVKSFLWIIFWTVGISKVGAFEASLILTH